MICACCDNPVEPEQAQESNFCLVCENAGCTAFHAEHTASKLQSHAENQRNTAD